MRPTQVRPAEPADVPDLIDLCLAAREESMVGNQVCSPDREALDRQLRALGGLPGGVLLLARAEDGPVGLLIGRVVGPSPFTDTASLAVEAVYVAHDARRRGVGHALMSAAVDLAEVAGVEHVYAAPIPGARGMQRFFVQLGFTPAASHRVTTLAALRRRLTADAPRTGRRSVQRSLEDLIARRRHTRAVTGEIPVVPPAQEVADSSTRQVRRAVHSRRPAESATTTS